MAGQATFRGLLYAGKARSGYTLESAERLREMLHPYIRSTSPLDEPLHKPKATWVESVIAAEIAYSSARVNACRIIRGLL